MSDISGTNLESVTSLSVSDQFLWVTHYSLAISKMPSGSSQMTVLFISQLPPAHPRRRSEAFGNGRYGGSAGERSEAPLNYRTMLKSEKASKLRRAEAGGKQLAGIGQRCIRHPDSELTTCSVLSTLPYLL